MKVVALLMAIIAAITVHPSDAQPKCFKYWTRDQAGTQGIGQDKSIFTGVKIINSTLDCNIPLFFKNLTAAKTGLTTSNLAKGRITGRVPTSTYNGKMLLIIHKPKHVLRFNYDWITTAGNITAGGEGCFNNVKQGNVTRKTTFRGNPVKEWTFSTYQKPPCIP